MYLGDSPDCFRLMFWVINLCDVLLYVHQSRSVGRKYLNLRGNTVKRDGFRFGVVLAVVG